MSTLRYTQGFTLKKEVKGLDSFLVAINPLTKITVSSITQEDGRYFLTADSSVTSGWIPTSYEYQIQNAEGIEEKGKLVILKNLALSTTTNYQSMWEKALTEIDNIIYSRVKNPSNTIHVGDKSITYGSTEELERLRTWILARIADEKEEEGEATCSPDDQKIIKLWWR